MRERPLARHRQRQRSLRASLLAFDDVRRANIRVDPRRRASPISLGGSPAGILSPSPRRPPNAAPSTRNDTLPSESTPYSWGADYGFEDRQAGPRSVSRRPLSLAGTWSGTAVPSRIKPLRQIPTSLLLAAPSPRNSCQLRRHEPDRPVLRRRRPRIDLETGVHTLVQRGRSPVQRLGNLREDCVTSRTRRAGPGHSDS